MADPIVGTVETTKNPDGSIKTVKETFEVSDAGAQRIRNDIPVGVGGDPIQRIPWNAKGAALVAAGTYVKRIASQERCLRPVEVPLKDGGTAKYHCSRPCMSAGTDGEKFCPEHDAEVFRPAQDHPARPGRVLNSASIALTDAEMNVNYQDKEGKRHVARLEEGRDVAQRKGTDIASPARPEGTRAPRKAKAVKRLSAPRGQVVVRFTVEELEGQDLVGVIRDRIVASLDGLPSSTIAQMKKVVWLQERIQKELQYQEEGK